MTTDAPSTRQKFDSVLEAARYRPRFTVALLTLCVLAAILEGIGLSFIVPIVQLAESGVAPGGEAEGLMGLFVGAYRFLGVPFTLEFVIVGVTTVESVTDLAEADAVSIAVPNHLHRPLGIEAIEAGYDVLIEKPLATTVEAAKAIAETAGECGAVLQVGHIERFNPAVEVLKRILRDEEVIALEAHRLGPFNEHLTQESVVFDLMIHDVDVIHDLVAEEEYYIDAVGRRSLSSKLDHAIAHLKYGNGVLGTATASHVTHGKIRTLNVTTHDAYIQLDYQNQHLTINRLGVERMTTMNQMSSYRTETISETPFVKTREPLKNQLEHFLHCVRTREQPRVSGSDGVQATKLATMIVEKARAN